MTINGTWYEGELQTQGFRGHTKRSHISVLLNLLTLNLFSLIEWRGLYLIRNFLLNDYSDYERDGPCPLVNRSDVSFNVTLGKTEICKVLLGPTNGRTNQLTNPKQSIPCANVFEFSFLHWLLAGFH